MADLEEKEITLSSKEQWQVLKRLFSYAKPHRKEFAVALTFLALLTVGEVLGPFLIKVFIDDFIIPRNIDVQMIAILAITFLVVQVTNAFLMYFQGVRR